MSNGDIKHQVTVAVPSTAATVMSRRLPRSVTDSKTTLVPESGGSGGRESGPGVHPDARPGSDVPVSIATVHSVTPSFAPVSGAELEKIKAHSGGSGGVGSSDNHQHQKKPVKHTTRARKVVRAVFVVAVAFSFVVTLPLPNASATIYSQKQAASAEEERTRSDYSRAVSTCSNLLYEDRCKHAELSKNETLITKWCPRWFDIFAQATNYWSLMNECGTLPANRKLNEKAGAASRRVLIHIIVLFFSVGVGPVVVLIITMFAWQVDWGVNPTHSTTRNKRTNISNGE